MGAWKLQDANFFPPCIRSLPPSRVSDSSRAMPAAAFIGRLCSILLHSEGANALLWEGTPEHVSPLRKFPLYAGVFIQILRWADSICPGAARFPSCAACSSSDHSGIHSWAACL